MTPAAAKIFAMDSADLPAFMEALSAAHSGKSMQQNRPAKWSFDRSLSGSFEIYPMVCQIRGRKSFGIINGANMNTAKMMTHAGLSTCLYPKIFSTYQKILIPYNSDRAIFLKNVEQAVNTCQSKVSTREINAQYMNDTGAQIFLLIVGKFNVPTRIFGIVASSQLEPVMFPYFLNMPYHHSMGELNLLCATG